MDLLGREQFPDRQWRSRMRRIHTDLSESHRDSPVLLHRNLRGLLRLAAAHPAKQAALRQDHRQRDLQTIAPGDHVLDIWHRAWIQTGLTAVHLGVEPMSPDYNDTGKQHRIIISFFDQFTPSIDFLQETYLICCMSCLSLCDSMSCLVNL